MNPASLTSETRWITAVPHCLANLERVCLRKAWAKALALPPLRLPHHTWCLLPIRFILALCFHYFLSFLFSSFFLLEKELVLNETKLQTCPRLKASNFEYVHLWVSLPPQTKNTVTFAKENLSLPKTIIKWLLAVTLTTFFF